MMKQENKYVNKELEKYIKENYEENVLENGIFQREVKRRISHKFKEWLVPLEEDDILEVEEELEEIIQRNDETFSQMLMRFIDEKGYTDVNVYKKADVDRKLFSKIRSQKDYHPKKQTVLAFAIALELTIQETSLLLESAGYALSKASKQDLIIKFYLEKGIHNRMEINEALLYYKQPLL